MVKPVVAGLIHHHFCCQVFDHQIFHQKKPKIATWLGQHGSCSPKNLTRIIFIFTATGRCSAVTMLNNFFQDVFSLTPKPPNTTVIQPDD